MKGILIAMICAVVFAQCKKKEMNTVSEQRYACVCNTVVTYVDHCGEAESKSDTSTFYSKTGEQASELCARGNALSADNYTIRTTACQLY
jgi:hypothetical protein